MRERHGREWQAGETEALKQALESGRSIADAALALGRSERAIRIRALRLGLIQAPEPKPTRSSLASKGARVDLPDSLPDEVDDESDPIPDRLRTALTRVVRACVSEPRRREIALQVLGLNSDGNPSTMAAIGRTLDRSRERIRQLRNSAFRRIAARLARDAGITAKLRVVLGDISADTDWRNPANAASSVVQLVTDNFAAAEIFTYVFCRAAGSTAPTKDLRQRCVEAAQAACGVRDRSASWRFDRLADALAKAIFHAVTYFESPPADLIGVKRIPQKPERDRDFSSRRLGRTVLCESATEARVYRWLERSADVRWYQEQPGSLAYEIGGIVREYYPDVAVMGMDGRVVVVEVKPIFRMYRYRTLAKAVAALNHYGARGIGYLLVDGSGRTLDDIASHAFSDDAAERIEELFRHEPVRFGVIRHEITRLVGRFDSATFASMVVNRDWGVTDGPGVRVFKLPEGLSFRALRERAR